jgi:oxalate decarboxylase/phosphoglucose isomerase-like protein (cupin superfamily)
MRKYALIIFVLVVVSLSAQRWALGQAPATGGQQAGGQGAGQGQGQNGAPRYQGKPMPPNMPGTYTVIRSADLATVLNQTGGDTPIRVADTPSGHYGAYILTYQPVAPTPGKDVNGTYHSQVAEIYYVINGTGSMALGGEMDNAREGNPESQNVKQVTGPSANGVMTNYTVVRFTPGTVIIVPPGVPHQAGYDIISKTDYLVIRVDPNKTIELK